MSPPFTVIARDPVSWQVGIDWGLTIATLACTVITLIPLVAVLGYVGSQGLQRLDGALLTQLPSAPGLTGGGIANALLGTGIVVGIATLIAVPFGILAAVYLAELSGNSPLTRWLRLAITSLSGLPAIIAGVFAYGLLVRSGWTGYSAIAGGIALAVLMVPTVVRTTDDALRLVPPELRWAAASVGASPYQMILYVILPAASPAILTGVMLAISRTAGETAPLIFTALSSAFWPQGPLEPIATLSVLIFNFATTPFAPQQQLAWAGALILVVVVLLVNITARLLTHLQRR